MTGRRTRLRILPDATPSAPRAARHTQRPARRAPARAPPREPAAYQIVQGMITATAVRRRQGLMEHAVERVTLRAERSGYRPGPDPLHGDDDPGEAESISIFWRRLAIVASTVRGGDRRGAPDLLQESRRPPARWQEQAQDAALRGGERCWSSRRLRAPEVDLAPVGGEPLGLARTACAQPASTAVTRASSSRAPKGLSRSRRRRRGGRAPCPLPIRARSA